MYVVNWAQWKCQINDVWCRLGYPNAVRVASGRAKWPALTHLLVSTEVTQVIYFFIKYVTLQYVPLTWEDAHRGWKRTMESSLLPLSTVGMFLSMVSGPTGCPCQAVLCALRSDPGSVSRDEEPTATCSLLVPLQSCLGSRLCHPGRGRLVEAYWSRQREFTRTRDERTRLRLVMGGWWWASRMETPTPHARAKKKKKKGNWTFIRKQRGYKYINLWVMIISII